MVLLPLLADCGGPASVPAPSPDPSDMAATQAAITVNGMFCSGCETLIQETVTALPGVLAVTASATEKVAVVDFDANRVTVAEIVEAINSGTDYEASPPPPAGS